MWKQLLLASIAVIACGQQAFSPAVQAAVGTPSSVLYAGTAKSVDLGQTWTPMYLNEAGTRQPTVLATVIDDENSSALYLITSAADGSFWKSTNAGATWRKSAAGLPATVSPEQLRQTSAPHALYIKAGTGVYKSTDRGDSWTLQSQLPGSDPVWEMSVTTPRKMYAADREPVALDSLRVYASDDEGRTWTAMSEISSGLTTQRSVQAIGIYHDRPNTLLVSVGGCCEFGGGIGQGTYFSENGGSRFALLGNGLSVFSRMFMGPGTSLYAVSAIAGGYQRSVNGGGTWTSSFLVGNLGVVGLTSVDPQDRTIVYGVGTSAGLVRSTDSAGTWTAIPATIMPTIGKPAGAIQIEVEEGASYSQSFGVQTAENATWVLPFTITKSPEVWLTLSLASGNTPASPSLTIRTAGLAPGVHTASVRIDAPGSFNKSVTIPIQVTVRPRGSLGAPYRASTVAGNGTFNGAASGAALEVATGSIGSLAVDQQGRLLIGADNRVRRLQEGNVTVVAGTGTSGTTGDGGDASAATLDGPQGLAVNRQGDIFVNERFQRKVRRIRGNVIESYLDTTKAPQFLGASAITLNAQERLLLAGTGVDIFDGQTFTRVVTGGTGTPAGLAIGPDGSYYLTDQSRHQILRFSTSGGTATVIAGTGTGGFSGDGGPALAAQLNTPTGIVFDARGTLFFTDSLNHRIRAISPDGVIRTIAGSGLAAFEGDGLTGSFVSFNRPGALAINAAGELFVADASNRRVRKLVLETAQVSALLHGASGNARLAPGSLFSIYGTQLGGTTRITGDTPWPRALDGVAVTINGVAAPLYYVSPTQINGQIPYETAVGTATAVVGGAQISFPVIAANPGVLVYNGNRAVAVNPNGAVNASNAGAKPGDVELLYFTGIGVPQGNVATGAGSPGTEPLGRSKYASSIKLNGQEVEVFYLGLAPGYPALCQANFRIPQLPPGDYPLTITVNGEESNIAILTVATP